VKDCLYPQTAQKDILSLSSDELVCAMHDTQCISDAVLLDQLDFVYQSEEQKYNFIF